MMGFGGSYIAATAQVANSIITNAKLATPGQYSLISTSTVTGAAVTTITFSSLDLATDGAYYLVYSLKNATASTADISFFVNSDTTATNYYAQYVGGDGAATYQGRGNNALIVALGANSYCYGYIQLVPSKNTFPYALGMSIANTTTAIKPQFVGWYWNSNTNVTSITFSSSVASALAVSSSISLYKVSQS